MARHLLRDYLTPGAGNFTAPYVGAYLAAIFMRRVLGYSYVGDTRFPINSVGSLLISTADSTPTGAPTFAVSTKAGINLGLGLEFNVSIPVATRTVGSGDTGRILVLKSTANPTYNSGCFLITGFDSGTNSYAVDFRTGATLSGATTLTGTQTLPAGTLNVVSTTGFPTSGSILVVSSTGTQTINYTGTNATQFTGCTGGTGTVGSGSPVNRSITLPQATISVNSTSTTHFPSSGTLFIYSSAGRQTVTYTGITATSFTGCTGGTGTVVSGVADGNGRFASPIIATINTTIAAGSNGQSLPQSTINVASTTTATTTIAVSSNNIPLPTGTINVASTTGFATSGWIYVTTGNGPQLVTYTGTTSTTFTGCTGGTGYMATGGAVVAGYNPTGGIIYVTTSTGVSQVAYTGTTSTSFTGCTGGSGTMSTSNLVYYSPMVPRIEAADSMNWYLYETDTLGPQIGNQNLVSPTFSVTNETGSNGTPYTITVSGSHQFVTGQRVTISGVTGVSNGSNGTFTVTVTGSNTFQPQGLTWGASTTYTGGGTVVIPDVVLPATLFVNSSANYSTVLTNLYVHSSSGIQKVSWSGSAVSAGGKVALTGISGGVGTVSIGNPIYDNTSNGNSTSQYRGNGTSTAPRIILQSPVALGWQVRICHETVDDNGSTGASQSAECPMITMIPGFGGNASGDFLVSGQHIHAPLYLNSNNNNLQGGAPGFGDNLNFPNGLSAEPYRITIIGDTDGYGLTVLGRRPGNATGPRSYLMTLGMCESEALPLPTNNEARLFAIGSGNSQSSGNNLNDISWYPGNIGTGGTCQGITQSPAFGSVAVPSALCTSLLCYAVGNSSQGSPIFDGSAGDTPWFGGVELFPADLISGTFNTWNNSAVTNYGFPFTQGRFLGTIPHIREGRTNFTEFGVTADLVAQHVRRGLWMLWGGPPVVP